VNLPRKRLTRKLVLLTVLPTVALIAAFAIVLAVMWQRLLSEDADRELADHVALVRVMLPPLRTAGAKVNLARLAEQLSETQRVLGVALYDHAGRPIGHSDLLARAPERVDAIARTTLASGREYHTTEVIGGELALVRAERVEGPSDLGVVVVSHSLDPVREIVLDGLVGLAGAGLLLVAALGGLAWLLSRALGAALGDLIHGAELVTAGDLRARVVPTPRFELDAVARTFNDMTEALAAAREAIERSQAERRELSRRIQQAQALTLVGQVSASFAHEIGSPLNTILGWARLANADESLPEATRQQFDTIAQQCARITRIVERMLRMARPAAEDRVPCDLSEVAREVADFLTPDCRARRVAMTVTASPELPRVRWTRDELLQLVMNLAMNALQAQPDGGVLDVALSRDGDKVVLEVSDGGTGVPPEVRERLFEPFYSTKRPHGGTGLGLWIVSDIVRELRGTIAVSDRPGGGAVFRVVLPGEPSPPVSD